MLIRLRHVALVCLSLVFLAAHADEKQAVDPKRIVMVQTSNALLPSVTASTQALRDTLTNGMHEPLLFAEETLGAIANMGFEQEEESRAVARLQERYSRERVDVVLAAGSVALGFVERNRALIWPGAPVLYYGVSDRQIAGRVFDADIGGLTIHFDLAGTLALATRLQPDAKHVVYVGGAAPYDKVFEPIFAEAVGAYGDRFDVTMLTGAPLATLQRELSKLPPDAIVLYTSMFRDADGVDYTPADLVRFLTENSAAPVYGFFGSYLGEGIVGGSVIDFAEHGRGAGLEAVRILASDRRQSAASLPHIAFPSACTIDRRGIERWKLNLDLAPEGCRFLETESPLLARQDHAVLLAASALVVLAVSAAAFVRVRTRSRGRAARRGATNELDTTHTARLALVGEITASITHEVTQPLSAILSNADAAEMLLQKRDPSLAEIREILADIRRDNLRAQQIVGQLRSLLQKRELAIGEVNLNQLAESALALIRAETSRRGITVRSKLDPELPSAAGDLVHLQQVLLNLLVNAMDSLEAQPQHSRRLEISTSRQDDGPLCISVRDSGAGIAPSHLQHLFDSFFTTKRNGMGLGLSIAKTIIEAHGGQITAFNAPAGGAVFQFTLPVAQTERMCAITRPEHSSPAPMPSSHGP